MPRKGQHNAKLCEISLIRSKQIERVERCADELSLLARLTPAVRQIGRICYPTSKAPGVGRAG